MIYQNKYMNIIKTKIQKNQTNILKNYVVYMNKINYLEIYNNFNNNTNQKWNS